MDFDRSHFDFLNGGRAYKHLGPLEKRVLEASKMTDLDPDGVVFIGCMVASIVLSTFFRFIPFAKPRLFFSFIFGLVFCYSLYGPMQIVLLLAFAIVHYGLMFVMRPGMVFFIAMLVLSAEHVHRQMTDYMSYRVDACAARMLMVAKIAMTAYDIDDGRKVNRKEKLHDKEHIDNVRRELALTQAPSFFSFLSYMFFFNGVLTGPVCNYCTFRDFIAKKDEFARGASPWISAFLCLFYAGICLVFFKFLGPTFVAFDVIFTDLFMSHYVPVRFAYVIVATNFARYKYYFVWYLGEVGCILSGFGIRTKGGVTRYDAARNAFAWSVETAENIGGMMASWNVSVSRWLKLYVYERISATMGLPKKTWATIVTRLTSCVWHGFYPGYYMSFGCSILVDMATGACRNKIWPRMEGNPTRSFLYRQAGKFLTAITTLYIGSPFLALSFERAFIIWESTLFIVHLACIGVYVFLVVVPAKAKEE